MTSRTMRLRSHPRASHFGPTTAHNVFAICNRLKVEWINAIALPAKVVDYQPLRDFCTKDLIRKPVGTKFYPAPVSAPVTVFIQPGLPNPARRSQWANGEDNLRQKVFLAGHAARPQGSICSSIAICSSDRSASIACRQPVLRMIWIASEREGCRAPVIISLAYEREIPAVSAKSE